MDYNFNLSSPGQGRGQSVAQSPFGRLAGAEDMQGIGVSTSSQFNATPRSFPNQPLYPDPQRGFSSSHPDPLADIDDALSASYPPLTEDISPSQPSEAPWTHLAVSTTGRSPSTSTSLERGPKRRRLNGLSPGVPQYPRGPVSDSGYHTMSSRYSYPNGYIDQPSRPPAQNLFPQGNLQGYSHVFDDRSRMGNVSAPRHAVDDQESQVANDNASQHSSENEPRTWTCTEDEKCDWTGKCESEHKKHVKQHTRPFKCNYPGCPNTKGFPTQNDLERHKHAKHGIEPAEGRPKFKDWKCLVPGCPKSGHIFNRQDNFKAHLTRMHSELDTEEYMKQSEDNFNRERAAARQRQQLAPPDPATALDPHLFSTRWPDFQQSSSDYQSDLCRTMTPTNMNRIARPARPMKPGLMTTTAAAKPTASVNSSTALDYSQSFDGTQSMYNLAPNSMNSTMERSASTFSASHPQIPSSPYQLPPASSTHFDMTTFTGNHLETQSMPLPDNNHDDILSIDPNLAEPSSSVNVPNKHDDSADADLIGLLRTALDSKDQSSILDAAKKARLEIVLRAGIESLAEPKSSRTTATPSPDDSNASTESSRGPLSCPHCTTRTFERACDLRKHKKRHEKPYGCTYDNCGKTFGSKADWKRHENTMHVQMEGWRCPQNVSLKPGAGDNGKVSNPQPCNKVFYRREIFTSHLRAIHAVRDDGEAKRLASDPKVRIGRDGQTSFWCGFCKDLVILQGRGVKGNEERFDHIDVHFRDEGKNITSWISANRRADVVNLLDDTDSEEERNRLRVKEKTLAKRKGGGRRKDQAKDNNKNTTAATARTHGNDSSGASAEQRRLWCCCACGDGPKLWATSTVCLGCGHYRNQNQCCNSWIPDPEQMGV